MADTEEARQVRAAENQALFREVNERLESLNDTFEPLLPLGDWVCECADPACVERVAMTIAEYEAIRSCGNRFPVLPGHEQLDVERVVERHTGYVVVEKLGAGAAVARSSAPRGRNGR